ncbi:MAG: DNA gyrase inhibitor YacG [Chthoniobacteraceae bacterium]|jgi:uncharacterized protein
MAASTLVKCPTCGHENDFNAAPLGPFCSMRCKLIDLGKWFDEDYRISEPLRPDHFAEYQELEGRALDDPGQDT